MSKSVTQHPLISSYLDRLTREAVPLTPSRREELVQEIRSHIEDLLPAGPSEAEVSDVLGRLGTPEEIVEAELVDIEEATGGRAGRSPLRTAIASLRPRDVLGMVLLLTGGAVLPPVGYLAGAALVGLSPRWSPAARLLLVALPCTAGMIVLTGLDGWYTPADLVEDPRRMLTGFLHLGFDVLPCTAVQVLALIAVRLLPGRLGAGRR
ncbi:HAAS signaling domain-containing protein [Saccharothrix algeriensis]|uniref:DUF1700 domain-containing protein n=1 Tax=Saccharothrix algeriensis TaxID=173560 RepID=A0A8T8HZU5_9PSEU|nr:hypothetical protein [Saccharothrix algeriensis]MBM7809777.1 hypothetical protein [Saccharothrix algeriensis]QTR04052.1 hypothetical protein J7S33_03395 [Saccharothrix algeriensis]